VLVINPRLPKEQTLDIRRQAKFQSKLPFGDGFVEVVSYLLRQRSAGTGKTTLND
jgi:hypothetical protein